jgi:hypothetical protein
MQLTLCQSCICVEKWRAAFVEKRESSEGKRCTINYSRDGLCKVAEEALLVRRHGTLLASEECLL